jgi:hypothetical protein
MPDHNNPDPERVDTGRLGGLTSWVNADFRGERHQRMEHVRSNSPAADGYWERKLGFTRGPDGELTAQQCNQIATAKRLYFARLRRSSVAATKRAKAERLQQQAAKIEAELESEAGA